MRALLALDQVAERMGVGGDWLKGKLPRLYRTGFPRPLPLPGVKRWDPAALDLWLDRWLEKPPAPENSTNPPFGGVAANDPAPAVDEADEWAAIIDRRAEALARGE